MSFAENFFYFSQQFAGFAINLKHEVTWWNKVNEKLTGVSEKDVLHTDNYWKIFYHTQKVLPVDLLLMEDTDREKEFPSLNFFGDICYGFLKIEKNINDKSLLWVIASKVFDGNRQLIGAIMSFQLISLRHLYWNSPLLGELIMRFPLPIAIILNGHITLANKLYAALLGCASPKEIAGKPVETFIHSLDRKKYRELSKNNYQNIVSEKEYDWKYSVQNSIRYVTEIPTVFKKEDDTLLVSTFIDKTEEIQKEKQLMEEKEELLAANKNLIKLLREKDGFFISQSPKMKNVIEKALRLAKSEINVVILGETGTGKSLLAKIIHEAGTRKDKPFIAVNCAAIPETLMESAFFGYVKGAFTNAHSTSRGFLEAAHEGTLFLDEVAELSPAMQAKLLHAVENKLFTPLGSTVQKACDVRIISATHRNLNQMLQEKKLREDFFYRICVVDLYLPALRERKEDIPLLIGFFLKRFSGTDTPPRIPERVFAQMMDAPWAGNIRELQNAILRFIATGELQEMQEMRQVSIKEEFFAKEDRLFDLELCKTETERRCLEHALKCAKGNKSRAAKLMKMNIRTFHRYCAKHNI